MTTPENTRNAAENDLHRTLVDRLEIESLAVAYARGTDAIALGKLDEGRRFYAQCFTEDAVVEASFPNNDPSGPPDLIANGPAAWAEETRKMFSSQGYTATQHLLGTFVIEVRGETATMQCYVHAIHTLGPQGPIDVANGTYVDEVVHTPRGWRIARRTLRLIDFLRLQQAPAAG